jgi:hypothetical protein
LSSLRILDGLGQAGAFLVDPLCAGVGLSEGLGELDRVVANDLAHRRPICGSPLLLYVDEAALLDPDQQRVKALLSPRV